MAEETNMPTVGSEIDDTAQSQTDTATDSGLEANSHINSLRDELGRFKPKNSPSEGPTEAASKNDDTAGQTDKPEDDGANKDSEPDKTAGDEPDNAPKFSNRQIEVAKQLNLDPEDLAALTPAQLLDAVGPKYNQVMSKLGRQLQEARGVTGKKAEPSETDNNGELKLDFVYGSEDYDSYDDEGGILAKQNRHLKATQSTMTRLGEIEAQLQERKDTELAEKTDAFFDSLDKEVFADFGTGPGSELGEDSYELSRRREVVKDAEALQLAHQFQGRTIPLEKALEKAVHDIYSDNIKAAERNKLSKRIQTRRGQGGQKPTARSSRLTPAATAEQKLADIAAEAKKSLGVNW